MPQRTPKKPRAAAAPRLAPRSEPPADRWEAEVFRALRPLQERGWRILCNWSWLDLRSEALRKQGEVDILLLGPKGFLVVEVKGGRVFSEQGQLFRWVEGAAVPLDPFEQAEASAHRIKDHANAYFNDPTWRREGGTKRFAYGCAVVLPGVEVEPLARTATGRAEILWDSSDLPRLDRLVEEQMARWCRGGESHFAPEEWLRFEEERLRDRWSARRKISSLSTSA